MRPVLRKRVAGSSTVVLACALAVGAVAQAAITRSADHADPCDGSSGVCAEQARHDGRTQSPYPPLPTPTPPPTPTPTPSPSPVPIYDAAVPSIDAASPFVDAGRF